MITKTVVRTNLSLLVDGQDLLFMKILLLFEKMEEIYIVISTLGFFHQIDENKFKEFVNKRFIDGRIGFYYK
jgi:hypothetical protein